MLLNNMIDYDIKSSHKLNFKGYHRFRSEGLFCNKSTIHNQIAFSIYSNCQKQLKLIQLYECFDDPLSQIIVEDLLIIYKKMKTKLENYTCKYTRKYDNNELIDDADKKRKTDSFLIMDQNDLENAKNEEFMGRRMIWLTFEEFSEIEFTENIPSLLYLVMYLFCGEDLLNYYAEVTGIKGFQYISVIRNNRNEYFLNRKNLDHIENLLKIETKQLARTIRRVKPSANSKIIDISVKLFQDLKKNKSGPISKISFMENSVFYILTFSPHSLVNSQKVLVDDSLMFLIVIIKEFLISLVSLVLYYQIQ